MPSNCTDPPLAQGVYAPDRADRVAVAAVHICADALRDGVNNLACLAAQEAVAAYLRDEFADIERQLAGERIAGLD